MVRNNMVCNNLCSLAAWLQLVHLASDSVTLAMDHCRTTTRYTPLCNFCVPISRSVLTDYVIHDIRIIIHIICSVYIILYVLYHL